MRIRYPKHQLSQRAYEHSCNVILFLKQLPKDLLTIVITKQLIRCITSIGANIVEAQASPTRKDFANFYNHALKSANESVFWLFLLEDAFGHKNTTMCELTRETEELAKILGASLKKLRSKKL